MKYTEEQEKQAQKVLEFLKGKTLKEIRQVLFVAMEIAEEKSILS